MLIDDINRDRCRRLEALLERASCYVTAAKTGFDPPGTKDDARNLLGAISAELEPCGECHLQPGEVCCICGRKERDSALNPIEQGLKRALKPGMRVVVRGKHGTVRSVHEPRWVDHKTRKPRVELQAADIVFDDTPAYSSGIVPSVAIPCEWIDPEGSDA